MSSKGYDLPAQLGRERLAVLELAGDTGALTGGVVADADVDRGGRHAAMLAVHNFDYHDGARQPVVLAQHPRRQHGMTHRLQRVMVA